MIRTTPHPYDVALAFLVRPAVTNAILARWLSSIRLTDPPKQTLGELMESYEAFAEEQANVYGGLVNSDCMIQLEEDLRAASDSPFALEESIERLTGLIADPENAIREETELFTADEKYGLIVRNVTRMTLADNFEDICQLFERLGAFIDNDVQMDLGTDNPLNQSRYSARRRQSRVSDAFHHSRMDVSGISASPSKASVTSITKDRSLKNVNSEAFRKGAARLETRATIEGLHVFYDHASRRMTKLLSPAHPFAESLRSDGHPNRKAVYMQHAVLELASVHLALGNEEEAFLAAREAVSVSQQNLDETTLEASLNLFRKLDEEIRRTSFVTPKANDASRMDRVRAVLHQLVPKRAITMFRELDEVSDQKFTTKRSLLRSDAWEQFGHASLATVWTRRVTEEEDSTNVEDRALALCRLAMIRISCGRSGLKNCGGDIESARTDFDLIERAIEVLKSSGEASPSPSAVRITVDTMLEASHRYLLCAHEMGGAARIRSMYLALRGRRSSRMVMDWLIQNEMSDKAFSMLCYEQSNGNKSDVAEADSLLRMAKLFKKDRALVLAFKAWALARDLQLRTVCAVALVEAARACFESANYALSLSLVQKAMPQLVAHAPRWDVREAQLLEIKNIIKVNGIEEGVRRLEKLMHVMQSERKDPIMLSFLEEALYLLALGYDSLNQIPKRDKVSVAFMEIQSNRKKFVDEVRHAEEAANGAAAFAHDMCCPMSENAQVEAI